MRVDICIKRKRCTRYATSCEVFTYDNDNGNLAISRNVLSAFRRLTGEDVVWDRDERMWRHRESHDAPGRQQD
jgi:Family of unknown function (DUF6953)